MRKSRDEWMDACCCFELQDSEEFVMGPGGGRGCYGKPHIGYTEGILVAM